MGEGSGKAASPPHQWHLGDVSDKSVVRAMEKAQRHLFVPDDQADRAYENSALAIGRGQTTSQPFVIARMTEALRPRPEHRVLEIGSGSGYQTAVLAELVGTVYTVEIDPVLAEQARKRLHDLGYYNVELRVGDGNDGWIEQAPFDSIIVTAAAEDVPPPLMDQLKDGGRMVIPIGTPSESQELTVIEKHGKSVTTKGLMPVRFVPFRTTS